MAIFLTLLNNFVWFLAVEFYILMGWGSKADAILIGLPILYVLFVILSILKKDFILNHLIIANIAMFLVLLAILSFASVK